MAKKKIDTRDAFYAKTSFYISLGFWIPLFNVGLCVVSIILALKALRYQHDSPKQFRGRGYAIAALIISFAALILSLAFAVIYLYRQVTCQNVSTIL
jgi:hypothetical protein